MNDYISIHQIADDLLDHPLLKDLSFERIISYAYDFIRRIGSPKLFVDKTAIIDIKNHRGQLPCDFVSINQVIGKCNKEYVPTVDNFHTESNPNEIGLLTYKIQGKVIFTSQENEPIEISYRAMPLDEEGFPKLPNIEKFINALKLYIKVKAFEILFDLGKINQAVMIRTDLEYCWAVGQASSEMHMPSEDEMETITHIWNDMVINMCEHANHFATMHNREYLKRH